MHTRPLRIGITCYPTVGGSGVLATALGEQLAMRGHDVHFISYGRPFRLTRNSPRLHFHPVNVSDYGLFKYPDYTLPLSVRMAEVSRDFGLDVLHVHYAVPHATAAILARSMLPREQQPRVVTTLHGTDTTLLARDADYGPAIRHALQASDAITAVSFYLREETQRLLQLSRPIDVIHNFCVMPPVTRTRDEVRRELEVHDDDVLLLHSSNLRPVKRIDLLFDVIALLPREARCKLLILAGDSFTPFRSELHRRGLEDRVIVLEKAPDVENYVQAADLGLVTSDSESFCLSILEAMHFACPSVATAVGGIPEVIEHQQSGLLAPAGDAAQVASCVLDLVQHPERRQALGEASQRRAKELFAVEKIIPQYEALYRRVLESPAG